MKLHASGPSGVNTITGYGEGYVMVNGQRHESSLIVLPDRVAALERAGFDALSAEDFALSEDLERRNRAARHRAEAALPASAPHRARSPQAGIGLEVMDLQAACRTYNILVAEERKVAAALLFA